MQSLPTVRPLRRRYERVRLYAQTLHVKISGMQLEMCWFLSKKDATCKALDSFWQNCYCIFFLNLGSSFVRMTILIFLSDSLDHYILVVKKGASTRKCARRVLAASVATVPRSNLKNIKSSRIRVVKKGISSFRFYIIAVKGKFISGF